MYLIVDWIFFLIEDIKAYIFNLVHSMFFMETSGTIIVDRLKSQII